MHTPDPKKSDVPGTPPGPPAQSGASPISSGKSPGLAKGLHSNPINALAILKAVRRRWLAATLLGVLAAGAAGAAVWFLLPPPQYCASVKFLIPSKPEGALFEHPEAKAEFSSFEDTQMAIIKGQMVLNAALRQPQVAHLKELQKARDPVEWLEQQIHIDFPNGREILRLSISSDDAETCKVLVNAVSKAYLDEISNETTKQRQKHLDELKALTLQYEAKLKKLHEAVHEREKTVGGAGDLLLALKQLEAHDKSMAARQKLVGVESRLQDLETEETVAKGRDAATVEIPAQELDKLVDKRPEIADLLAQKAKKDNDIAYMKDHATGGLNHPEAIKLIAEADQLTKDLDARRRTLRAECEKLLRDQAAKAVQAQAIQLHDQVEQAQALRIALQSEIEQAEKEARDFNNAAVDLDELKPEIAEVAAVAARSAQEMEMLTVEQLDPLRVSPWEEVTVTRPDETDRKVKTAGMSAGGGFLLAVLLVGFLEFRARRLNAPHDLVQDLGMPVVGTVPARPYLYPTRRNVNWNALLAESVDSLRTMLLHGVGSGAVRVVLITSAVAGEGKTSLASHLAVSLARSGRKTLLIDGDLRSPAVHKLFNVRPGPGLSELLRGEVHVFEALCPAEVAGLYVLTAGTCDAPALSQLSQDGVGRILEQLKGSYDFIIVDSSPVLPVTDSLLLARHVEGVVLSVLQHVSTLPAVYAAYQRLASLGVVLLGAVVNGTRADVGLYGSGRYYISPPPGK